MIFRYFLHWIEVYSMNSSKVMGYFPEPLNLNSLFLKLLIGSFVKCCSGQHIQLDRAACRHLPFQEWMAGCHTGAGGPAATQPPAGRAWPPGYEFIPPLFNCISSHRRIITFICLFIFENLLSTHQILKFDANLMNCSTDQLVYTFTSSSTRPGWRLWWLFQRFELAGIC